MKRIEVKLSLSMVAPLLDLMRETSDGLGKQLAAPLKMEDLDSDFREAWFGDLLAAQNTDLHTLLGLFDSEFFSSGVVGFDEDNAEPIVRACSSLRLRLREHFLKNISDEILESGAIEIDELPEAARKAFMSYLFLAKIQELIIEHLDSVILDGSG